MAFSPWIRAGGGPSFYRKRERVLSNCRSLAGGSRVAARRRAVRAAERRREVALAREAGAECHLRQGVTPGGDESSPERQALCHHVLMRGRTERLPERARELAGS